MQTFAFLFTPMPAIIFLVPILLVAIVLLVAINKSKTSDGTAPVAPPTAVPVPSVETPPSSVSASTVSTPAFVPTQVVESSVAGVGQIATPEIVVPVTPPAQPIAVVTEPIHQEIQEEVVSQEVAPAPEVVVPGISFRPAEPAPIIAESEDRPFVPVVESQPLMEDVVVTNAVAASENIQRSQEEITQVSVEQDSTPFLQKETGEMPVNQSSISPHAASISSEIAPRKKLRPVF